MAPAGALYESRSGRKRAAQGMVELQSRTLGLDRADLSASIVDFDSIPIIDVADLSNPDRDKRLLVALRIREACERVGFMYIKSHGVPRDTFRGMYDAAATFFDLPIDEKMKVDLAQYSRHRGYCPAGVLSSDINNPGAIDLQEGYEVSVETPENDPDYLAGNPMYGPNIWPARPATFREAATAYLAEMVRLGKLLFRGFALSLGLGERWFDDKITKPMGQLRIIKYPEQIGPVDPSKIGIGAHTDYECFTILSQSEAGLQVQNFQGRWISAPLVEDALVINIGDCLQRWTNDVFRSTVHRVVNLSGRERFSLAFFFGANYDANIECLPTCQDEARPPKYEPVKAGEWTIRNIRAAYKTTRIEVV